MNRSAAIAALILAPLATQSCRPCHDWLFVRAASDGLSVTNAAQGGTTPVALFAELDRSNDERPYSVIVDDSRDASDNMVVTLNGFETPPTDRIELSVSIPVRAGAGDVYKIAQAFQPPDPSQWRFRAPVAPGQVEIGLVRSRYNSPGNYTPLFVATTASGEIRVTRRQPGLLELSVDAVATDAAGLAYRVAGTVQITTGSRGEVCPQIS